jgi:hypothetical protein
MFSVPEGRAANQPLAETTFNPPIEASLPEETRCEPFEADGHFPKLAAEAGYDAIDETTTDECFTDDCICRPLRAVGEEITDGDGEVMVWVQKTGGGSDDAVPIRVGIVAEGDVKAVLKFDQPAIAYGLEQSIRIFPS